MSFKNFSSDSFWQSLRSVFTFVKSFIKENLDNDILETMQIPPQVFHLLSLDNVANFEINHVLRLGDQKGKKSFDLVWIF